MQPQEEWQKKKNFVQSGPTVMFPVWTAKCWLSFSLQEVNNFYFHIQDLPFFLKWGKKETNPRYTGQLEMLWCPSYQAAAAKINSMLLSVSHTYPV